MDVVSVVICRIGSSNDSVVVSVVGVGCSCSYDVEGGVPPVYSIVGVIVPGIGSGVGVSPGVAVVVAWVGNDVSY